ncbi:hypothetical protein ASPCAL14982 [Aspergillus calidoustus]|uniref:Zn(2)-C6 fungal-type domain-containing protein n=1 Tax=Aspergillus calidoustus TaxID=454130 RepID=A0A0U5GPF0_ASPCI|nr:hypothetical protein ASPCAL14982 [Aspergillus calidoustus]
MLTISRGLTKKTRWHEKVEDRLSHLQHIKCDEAPESCRNCTSTGRSCEYDLQRLPAWVEPALKGRPQSNSLYLGQSRTGSTGL